MGIPVTQLIDCYWVLPGRFLAGQYPVRAGMQDAVARLDALLTAGIDSFISLAEADEMGDYRPLLEQRANIKGTSVNCITFPIVDLGLPEPGTMRLILDTIDQTLAKGDRIYLHCIGGIGRTGMVVGCYLVRHGRSGTEAVQQIHDYWRSEPARRYIPMSPETPAQVQFVLNWREHESTSNE